MKRSSLGLEVAVLLVLAAPLACHDNDYQPSEGQVVTGRFAAGFEMFAFRPCDLDENWWVDTAPASLSEEYGRLVTQPYDEAYLRARGTWSELGEYGHVGFYDREFRISEILEIRELNPNECPY